MDTPQDAQFDLVSQRLGALPLVNHFLDRMDLSGLLARWLPAPDRRFRLDPAVAIRLVVVNLLIGRAPLYGLGEWAAPFAPTLLGLGEADTAWLNDDRVGRALEKLFHADRASLLTELIVGVVSEFGVATSELHNDSTSVSVHGAYRGADGTPRGGKPTPVITFGHSKDHRPDLKQLVWILTISADGAVPMAYRLADGNTSDDPTHVPTWDHLVALLGRRDFLYIADSKLASGVAMRHIDGNGGRFITVLPRTRGEDKWFRDWAQTNQPQWTEAIRLPGARIGDPDKVYSTFPAPLPSAEGYRIIWVHSSTKATRDAAARQARVEAGAAAIDALAAKLTGPKSRLRTRTAVDEAAAAALADAGAARWIAVTITETVEETYHQERRGRPGTNTRYRKNNKTRYTISWQPRTDVIAYDAATDAELGFHIIRGLHSESAVAVEKWSSDPGLTTAAPSDVAGGNVRRPPVAASIDLSDEEFVSVPVQTYVFGSPVTGVSASTPVLRGLSPGWRHAVGDACSVVADGVCCAA